MTASARLCQSLSDNRQSRLGRLDVVVQHLEFALHPHERMLDHVADREACAVANEVDEAYDVLLSANHKRTTASVGVLPSPIEPDPRAVVSSSDSNSK